MIRSLLRAFRRGKPGDEPPEPVEEDGLENLLGELLRTREMLPASSSSGECPEVEQLMGLLSGRIGDEQRGALLAHLDSCPECMEGIAAATRALRGEAQDDTGVPRTALPVVDLPSVRAAWSPPRPRRSWHWKLALGGGAVATAVCVILVVLLPDPALRMRVQMMNGTVRSGLAGGSGCTGVLREGDPIRIGISADKSGFFFLYVWNDSQGGHFAFPQDVAGAGNRIEEGQSLLVPSTGFWQIQDVHDGEEYLYLLYSAREVPLVELSRISAQVGASARTEPEVRALLGRELSVEQVQCYCTHPARLAPEEPP